nr:LysE family transporter [Kibdelosporangium aridum]
MISLTARTSLRVGAAAALGVATADGLYALAAVLGGVALAELIEPIAGPMRWAAAIVLVAMAVKTVVDARKQSQRKEVTARSAYFGLLGLTVLNPATIVYFGALVLGMQADVVPDLVHGMVFVLGALLASASWQLLLAGSGSLVGRVLTGTRGRLITALVSSGVIIVLAVRLVTS